MEIFVSEKEKLVTYPLGATVKSLEQHDRELLEELEVCKRALQIADLETEGMKEYLLEKARKELEDEKQLQQKSGTYKTK